MIVALEEPSGQRTRSKTTSTTSATTPDSDPPSVGFNLLQSIKDLTQQELNRANPLGLLGKEVIHATGTTHCPEPVPPRERDDVSTVSSVSVSSAVVPLDYEPQQLLFSLNDEEKMHMQRRRSTLTNNAELALPPCPAEFISTPNDSTAQSHLFSAPSPNTMLADFIPETMAINVFEVFIYAWGVFAFFFDMITDLVLAHAYYLEGAYWLFILTLMCVILPNLTLSVFSLVWYIDSSQLKATVHNQSQTSEQTSYYRADDSLTRENEQDQVDAHVSRPRRYPTAPEPSAKRTSRQFTTATADVFTWFIRIVILVLQLDLCLK
jgi:hypothetical protein